MKIHLDFALIWFTAATVFALPFFSCGMDFPSAFFESVSALSSVGITSVAEDNLLYCYRAFLAFVGGILFLVTLPYLISTSDSFKFAIHENLAAKNIIYAYILIYFLGAILYFFFGETLLNSLILSALTVSTAGGIMISEDLIFPASFLMFVSTVFPLLYIFLDLKTDAVLLLKREQFKVFLIIFLLAFGYLIFNNILPARAFFYIISFMSTTGFFLKDFYFTVDNEIYVLFVLAFMGGLIGSAGGGVKLFRIIMLFKIFLAELKRVLNPRMVTVIKLNNSSVPTDIIGKVLIFFFLYSSVIFAFSVILALFNIPYESAAAVSVSLLTTVGVLPSDLKAILFNSDLLLKLITAFMFMIVRLKIFIFFILIQSFYENITSGVHSWKKL